VPADATKDSHEKERSQFKECALGVQYGMGEKSLANRLQAPLWRGRHLIALHREVYPRYWQWSQAQLDYGLLSGRLSTVFGWRLHVEGPQRPGTLANFPVQATGAEILRLACCLLTEAGLNVCAPVHDAVLIEGAVEEIDAAVAQAQALMGRAAEVVLAGFPIRTEAKVIRHPERYMDKRGKGM
jgi:DNA polymerase I-like protein with 3'-5' exonuclease and polymerase domains